MEYFATATDVDGSIAGLTEPDIEAMLVDVWGTLDLPETPAQLDPGVEARISASADLQGDAENQGAALKLMVTADRGAAGLLAAAFFGSDATSGPDEVDDAVGELANMCAGAVKTLLEGAWVIDIPARADENARLDGNWIEATVPVQAGWVRLAVGQGGPGDPGDS